MSRWHLSWDDRSCDSRGARSGLWGIGGIQIATALAVSQMVQLAFPQVTASPGFVSLQLSPLPSAPVNPHGDLVLLFFLLEAAAFGGLAYATRFSLRLDPKALEDEMLKKALTASLGDIICRPVSQVLMFSILSTLGLAFVSMLPTPFLMVLLPLLALLLPFQIAGVFSLLVIIPQTFTQAAAFVFIYRALGGTRWFGGLMVFMVMYSVRNYLSRFDALTLAAQSGVKLSMLRFASAAASVTTFPLQLPALLCIRRRFYVTPQIHSKPSVKLDILKSSTLLAALPIVAASVFESLALRFVGTQHFASNAVTVLSSILYISVNAGTAIVAVDRVLVSSDFNWHWIAFLVPAIPVLLTSILSLLIIYFSTPTPGVNLGLATILSNLVHASCNAGTLGVTSGFLYIQHLARVSRREMNNVSETYELRPLAA